MFKVQEFFWCVLQREMQLELQNRLQNRVPQGASCPSSNNLSQTELNSLAGQAAASTFLESPNIQDSQTPLYHEQHLPSSSLIDASHDQIEILQPEKRSELIFTEVGQGQYVCTGVPRMMAFGSPLQLLPVNMEWPSVSCEQPVRTLHERSFPLKAEGMEPDRISYVVPVNPPSFIKRSTSPRLKANCSKRTGE